MAIAENIARILERMQTACKRAGRDAAGVRLIAVSKTHPAFAVREAYAAGQREFGENRVQEFAAKTAELGDLHDLQCALIGHLQSNKAAKAAEIFTSVQSVDSLKLAQRLNDAATAAGKTLPVLVEIKLSYEDTKHGIAPGSLELMDLMEALPGLSSLAMRGLMTVPPYDENLEAVRPYFKQLREMRDALAAQCPKLSFDELSMGMSHDFEIAIEEGSTCVRVGTAIFGARDYSE